MRVEPLATTSSFIFSIDERYNYGENDYGFSRLSGFLSIDRVDGFKFKVNVKTERVQFNAITNCHYA